MLSKKIEHVSILKSIYPLYTLQKNYRQVTKNIQLLESLLLLELYRLLYKHSRIFVLHIFYIEVNPRECLSINPKIRLFSELPTTEYF